MLELSQDTPDSILGRDRAIETKGAAEAAPFQGQPGLSALGYHHRMRWWEETVHRLVAMHDWQQQKQLEEAIYRYRVSPSHNYGSD